MMIKSIFSDLSTKLSNQLFLIQMKRLFQTETLRDHPCWQVPDCVNVSSSRADRLHPNANTIIGNGRCSTVDEEAEPARPRQRGPPQGSWGLPQRGWAPRVAVLVHAVEGLFLSGSIAALLSTVAVLLCLDAVTASAVDLIGTLVGSDLLRSLLERSVDDVHSSIDAFSEFLSVELTAPLCVDLFDLDVLKLSSSSYHRRRYDVAGIIIIIIIVYYVIKGNMNLYK